MNVISLLVKSICFSFVILLISGLTTSMENNGFSDLNKTGSALLFEALAQAIAPLGHAMQYTGRKTGNLQSCAGLCIFLQAHEPPEIVQLVCLEQIVLLVNV